MNDINQLANVAMLLLRQNVNGTSTYAKSLEVYMAIQHNPSILKEVTCPKIVSRALMVLLSFRTIDDIDLKQRISSIAYYLTSKAIETNHTDLNLYKDRVQNIIENKESFGYTVSEVVNEGVDYSEPRASLNWIYERDAIIKMEMYDFSIGGKPLITFDPLFTNEFMEKMNQIDFGTLGDNVDIDNIIKEGGELHSKMFDYLKGKLIDNEDIDF